MYTYLMNVDKLTAIQKWRQVLLLPSFQWKYGYFWSWRSLLSLVNFSKVLTKADSINSAELQHPNTDNPLNSHPNISSNTNSNINKPSKTVGWLKFYDLVQNLIRDVSQLWCGILIMSCCPQRRFMTLKDAWHR